jgi:hypothetical protein
MLVIPVTKGNVDAAPALRFSNAAKIKEKDKKEHCFHDVFI